MKEKSAVKLNVVTTADQPCRVFDQSIPSHLQDIFGSAKFRSAQRRYNGLFAFTGLGAGGIEKRSWTQPAPSMLLSLHGRAYIPQNLWFARALQQH